MGILAFAVVLLCDMKFNERCHHTRVERGLSFVGLLKVLDHSENNRWSDEQLQNKEVYRYIPCIQEI